MPATNLAIRDKIARELQNRETLPWALENRKLFPNAIFGNNVKYSPLDDNDDDFYEDVDDEDECNSI